MLMPNLCPLLAGPLLIPLTGDPEAQQGAHLSLSGPSEESCTRKSWNIQSWMSTNMLPLMAILKV